MKSVPALLLLSPWPALAAVSLSHARSTEDEIGGTNRVLKSWGPAPAWGSSPAPAPAWGGAYVSAPESASEFAWGPPPAPAGTWNNPTDTWSGPADTWNGPSTWSSPWSPPKQKKENCSCDDCEKCKCTHRCLGRCKERAGSGIEERQNWCRFGVEMLEKQFVMDSQCGERPPAYWLYWSELAWEEKQAATNLGYDANIWNNGGTPNRFDDMSWRSISQNQRDWFGMIGIGKGLYYKHYWDTSWNDLPSEVREAAETLNYRKHRWDTCHEAYCTKKEEKDFDDLTQSEKDAAGVLGYDCWLWDHYHEYYDPCYEHLGEFDGFNWLGTDCYEYAYCWQDHEYEFCQDCAENPKGYGCTLDYCLDGCLDDQYFKKECNKECGCYCDEEKERNLATRLSARCLNTMDLCCNKSTTTEINSCFGNQRHKEHARCCKLPKTFQGCTSPDYDPFTNPDFFECAWYKP